MSRRDWLPSPASVRIRIRIRRKPRFPIHPYWSPSSPTVKALQYGSELSGARPFSAGPELVTLSHGDKRPMFGANPRASLATDDQGDIARALVGCDTDAATSLAMSHGAGRSSRCRIKFQQVLEAIEALPQLETEGPVSARYLHPISAIRADNGSCWFWIPLAIGYGARGLPMEPPRPRHWALLSRAHLRSL